MNELYLPRSWGSERSAGKGAGQVFVRNASNRSYHERQAYNPTQNQITSQRALVTLLREGGHWDDVDEEEARVSNRISDLEKGFEGPLSHRKSDGKLGAIGEYELPGSDGMTSHRKPVPSMVSPSMVDRECTDSPSSRTSPRLSVRHEIVIAPRLLIVVAVQPRVPELPTQIRIQIEQEVHQTTVDVEAAPERTVKPANYRPDYL
jgi:hypothetical protein